MAISNEDINAVITAIQNRTKRVGDATEMEDLLGSKLLAVDANGDVRKIDPTNVKTEAVAEIKTPDGTPLEKAPEDGSVTLPQLTTDDIDVAGVGTDLTALLQNQQSWINGKVPKATKINGHPLTDDVTLTKADVGLHNVTDAAQVKRTEMGAPDGVATLDETGKVPANQLPAMVDIVQSITDDTDKVPSSKAVYDELTYPDVVYEKIQDLPSISNGNSYGVSGELFIYHTNNSNFCVSGLIDVRNYDTVTWLRYAGSNAKVILADKDGLYLSQVSVGDVQSISREDYPSLGYVMISSHYSHYNNNLTIQLTLTNSRRVKKQTELTRQDTNQLKHGLVRINYDLTVYTGERMTNKTIVIMGNSEGSSQRMLMGTVFLDWATVNLCYVKSSGGTILASFNHGNKQSYSLILTFDDEGNLRVYQNGVLKVTVTYDKFPDTDWNLYIRYNTTLSHFSILNCALDDYISVIEHMGWQDWFPNTIWTQKAGWTFSGTTTKGGWIQPSGLGNFMLVKAEMTLVNETSSSVSCSASNIIYYPSGSISVPAGETVTVTKIIDVKAQKALGLYGNTNQTGLSSSYSGYAIGFLWGIDARYCHDGGFYNLNGLMYESAKITLLTDEAVPQVLATGAAGSAVGQIRVDDNGNLQMYNGTTWKQINNS